jgi:hypothetical protein
MECRGGAGPARAGETGGDFPKERTGQLSLPNLTLTLTLTRSARDSRRCRTSSSVGRASAGCTRARRASQRCSSRTSCATCCRRRVPSRRDPRGRSTPYRVPGAVCLACIAHERSDSASSATRKVASATRSINLKWDAYYTYILNVIRFRWVGYGRALVENGVQKPLYL